MKKNNIKTVAESFSSYKGASRSAVGNASSSNHESNTVGGMFYFDRTEFEKMRAELKRPVKLDAKLIKLMETNSRVKWARESWNF